MNNAAAAVRRQSGPPLELRARNFAYRRADGALVVPGGHLEALRAAFGARPRRVLRRRDHVYLQRETCRSLFMIDSGSVKSCIVLPDGTEHVLGFHLPGDVIGIDGMSRTEYCHSTIALEHTSVSSFELERLRGAGAGQPALAGCVIAILAEEVSRERALRVQRSCLCAEDRVCSFLLDWSGRLGERGYSPTRLRLPMSRIELGNHLGMSQETVSRVFTALCRRGLVQTNGRYAEIVEPHELRARVEARLSA